MTPKRPETEVLARHLASRPGCRSQRRYAIACYLNHHVSPVLRSHLEEMGVDSLYTEGGRIVRQLAGPYPLGIPGTRIRINNSPVDLFRFTVPPERGTEVARSVIHAAKLHMPGRGSIFAQEILQVGNGLEEAERSLSIRKEVSDPLWQTPMLQQLTHVICILSGPGKADRLAQVALELGIGIPLITRGRGTGIRDRLGLLRIAIPADKEIVHLVMPEHDFKSVFRLLMEEVGLNHPGRGYVYRTPVAYGMLDTRMRIGKQKYAATMDQIIAAIDQLKSGTDWRKRILCGLPREQERRLTLSDEHCQLSIYSLERRRDEYVQAAMEAGASGATTTRVTQTGWQRDEHESAVRSLSTLGVPSGMAVPIFLALLDVADAHGDTHDRFQLMDSPVCCAKGPSPTVVPSPKRSVD